MTYIDFTASRTEGMWNDAANTRQVIVIHDTESSTAAAALSWMISQQNGSYHLLVDTSGDVTRMVPDSRQAWAAMSSGNRIGLHICATGYAAWSLVAVRLLRRLAPRSRRFDSPCGSGARGSSIRWSSQTAELESIAQYVAGWGRLYNIPLVRVTGSQIRAGARGVCGHQDISDAFGESDHTDPGPNFPFTSVIDRAIEINGGGNLVGLNDEELSTVAARFRQLGPS